MIYIEKEVSLNDFNHYKQVVVVFKFYDNEGHMSEILIHKYRKQNNEFFVNIKNVAENTFIKNIPIHDTDNMIKEINEWIKHDYYCNEKGSIIIYTLGEE